MLPFSPDRSSAALRVTLTVSSAGRHQNLVETVSRAGVLGAVIRMGPDLEMFEAGVGGALRRTHRFASYRAGNRVLWGILRRSPIGFPQAQLPLLAWSWAADRMIARWIRPCDVFYGLTGVCLASARSAKQLGAAILIDKATLHPSAWQREVLADCTSAGVCPASCEGLLPKMLIIFGGWHPSLTPAPDSAGEFCALVTPDLCVAVLVYLAAALCFRMAGGPGGWGTSALLGLVAGLAYFGKAAMAPLGAAPLVLLAIPRISPLLRRKHLIAAVPIFAAAVGAHAFLISRRTHRFTFAEVGRLAYAWLVERRSRFLWDGLVTRPGPAPQLTRPESLTSSQRS